MERIRKAIKNKTRQFGESQGKPGIRFCKGTSINDERKEIVVETTLVEDIAGVKHKDKRIAVVSSTGDNRIIKE